MKECKTWNEIEEYIANILIEVVNVVGQKAAKHLQENIDRYIYKYGDKFRTYYHNGTTTPTEEFLNTPTSTTAKRVGNSIETTVYHDTNKMSFDAESYKHGSDYWIINDIRKWLPEILNDNLSGDIFGSNQWYHNREPYFDITVKELIDNGLALKWVKEECKKRGLVVK